MVPEGDYFETVERRIRETESRIAAQLELIEQLKLDHRASAEAEGQLRNMLVGLKQLQSDRALMESFFNSKTASNIRRRK